MRPIFPQPKSADFSNKKVKIASISSAGFNLKCEFEGDLAASAIAHIEAEMNKQCLILPPFEGEYTIKISKDPHDPRLEGKGDEAYAIKITESEAELVGATDKGAYYAAITLAELVVCSGNGVYLPVCEIVDYPDCKTRGVLVESRYNDFMTLDDWKAAVDDFARLKLNKLEVAVYGCWSKQYDDKLSEQQYIPFKSIPEFKNPKARKFYSVKNGGFVNIPDTDPYMFTEDFFGDIIAYGKKKNVEVFPLFNSLGHNTLLPRVKPEISAKDEAGNPTNSGLCTSNEETYKTLFALYDEIIDRYLAPNGVTSFAVGLDEVSEAAFCKCSRCAKKTNQDKFTDHAIRLVKYLKERGMKDIYIYDDMYLYIFDNLNEELAGKFKAAGVYDVTVMDWWNYGASVDFFRGKADKINNCFGKNIVRPMSGYWHWQGWSDTTPNIAACTKTVKEHNFDGMISYSSYEPCLDYNYAFLSECCWTLTDDEDGSVASFAKKYFERYYPDNASEAEERWQTVRHRLHSYNYTEKPPANSEFAQYIYSYVKGGIDYPRNHIAEIIAKIDADPYRYLTYLRDLNSRANSALDFFISDKATPSAVNDNFIASISEQVMYSEQFLTLYRIYKDTAEGRMSTDEVISLVKGLIRKLKGHMLRVEQARIECIRHQTLRMMTINLEYLWELLAAAEEALAEGKTFVYDPEGALDRSAPVFKYLR
ncbi:MAG: family 20 glycosylhydrolase [Clostridia bacterium]|nr:family 20 glycosylhydrolase [Clostridia bacterium]